MISEKPKYYAHEENRLHRAVLDTERRLEVLRLQEQIARVNRQLKVLEVVRDIRRADAETDALTGEETAENYSKISDE